MVMDPDNILESESDQRDIVSFESDSDSDLTQENLLEKNLEPYQFEPYVSDEEIHEGSRDTDATSSPSTDADQRRLVSTNWCSCGSCTLMPTVPESICCREYDLVNNKCEEQGLCCILQHPGFHPVCLNAFVLETAYLQYRQQYGDTEETGPLRSRYTSYRQFVRWCWGYLGKKVRVALPSCVVTKIRETFPSQDYKGFLQIKN